MQERALPLPGQGSHQLQIPDRDLVEVQVGARVVDPEPLHPQRPARLSSPGVLEGQRRGREPHRRQPILGLGQLLGAQPFPAQAGFQERVGVARRLDAPGGAHADAAEGDQQRVVDAPVVDQLAGLQSADLRQRRGAVDEHARAELAGAELVGGQAHAPVAALGQRDEVVRDPGVEGLLFQTEAGGDHPDDLPRDHALDRLRVGHLFADGDLLALLQEASEVAGGGVMGHPGHRDVLAARPLAAGGQSDVEQLRGLDRVVVEELVEVTEPEEEECLRVLLLGPEELEHHRGVPPLLLGLLARGHAPAHS